MGFTKLDERILQSSIMAENAVVFKIWITLLAACKANGIAYVSAIYLSSICHLPLPRVEIALERLEAPDPHSRSLSDEGRRIRRVDGGYEIINYAVYRDASLRNAEAERKRLYRQRTRGCPDNVPNCPDSSASASSSASSSVNKNLIKDVVFYLNEKTEKRFSAKSENTIKLINGRASEGRTLEDFKKVIDIKVAQWKGDPEKEKYLRPETLFNATKFEGYVNEKMPPVQAGVNTHTKSQKDLEAQGARQDYIKAHPGDQEGLAEFTQKWFEEHP